MKEIRRFLLIRSGQYDYALPFEQVAEVAELRPLSPVPRAPAWCLGAMRSSGVVVAVVDLAAYNGDELECQPEKLVVLDLRLGGLALQVGQVTAISLDDQVRLEKDEYGYWLLTPSSKAELLDASELVQEISAAMAR